MKRSSLLCVPLVAGILASCGYTPLYAPSMGAESIANRLQVGMVEMNEVKRNVGERRMAQTVSQELKLQYPNTNTAMDSTMDTLTVSIEETTDTLAVQTTAAVRRAQITLEGTMVIQSPNGKPKLKTKVSTSTSYNVLSTPYGTESGKTFARLTAARNLADEISRRVVLYYRTEGHSAQAK
jgi:hypothetical protein